MIVVILARAVRWLMDGSIVGPEVMLGTVVVVVVGLVVVQPEAPVLCLGL